MSERVDVSAALQQNKRDPERTFDTLARVIIIALTIGALYIAREVLVPIAIAVLLSFVLSLPILALRRLGVNRVVAIMTVVFASLFIALAVSAALTEQVSELAVDLPKYQTTINAKIGNAREMLLTNGFLKKGANALKSFGDLGSKQPGSAAAPSASQKGAAPADAGGEPEPVPVVVREPAISPFAVVQTIAGRALSPIETMAVVVLFVVFILLQREDLRNRFIRLAGSNDLQRTTLAMNDAGARLSRFFLAQTLVNASFGVIVAGGLYVIGVPSPILFGILAFLLRFVPYIGSFISAAFPAALAAAVDPGWTRALETLALFLFVDAILGNVIEPFLYGHHTGLSPLAVVIAATFWTWLWGPIGLVLATPLTVCLVVLGRHVEQLSFLDVILGDAPALTPIEHFYQRMLVGDASEVSDKAEQYLKTASLLAYYDEVALPGLAMAQADLNRGTLHEAGQRKIKETVDELIDNLSDHADQQPDPSLGSDPADLPAAMDEESTPTLLPEAPPEWEPPTRAGGRKLILCVAGLSPLDEAAAALLAQILGKHGMEAKSEPPEALTLGAMPELSGRGAQIICVSYLDADVNLARVRFTIRRLRRRIPDARIIAGLWRFHDEQARDLCALTKADFAATSFADAARFCMAEVKAGALPDAPAPSNPPAAKAIEAPGTGAIFAGAA